MPDTAQPQKDTAGSSPLPENLKNHPPFFYLLLLLVPLLLILSFTPLKNMFAGKKAGNEIRLSFDPGKINLAANQEASVKIMADSGLKDVAFARIAVSFNPQILNLTADLVPNPLLKTVIDKTDPQIANQDGKAVWVVGASPNSDRPKGKFEIGTFKLKAVGSGQSELTFRSADLQIASGDAQEMQFQTSKAQVNIK